MNTKDAIASQYHASLDMLEQAITACPDALWDDRSHANVFWHVAYHALHYTHLYLQRSLQHFVPWPGRRGEHESLGRRPRPSDEANCEDEPYTREELLEYLAFCWREVEERLPSTALDAPSGFHWLPFDKLELQFYNIRHIQHHVGELYERLASAGGAEVGWAARHAAEGEERR